MALGRRRHGLAAAHRPSGPPGLASAPRARSTAAAKGRAWTEAAAGGRRHDPHRVRRDAEDARDVVAVHVGRLGAGEERWPRSPSRRARLSIAGLGLDVGVLDMAVSKRPGDGGPGKRRLESPRGDAAAEQHVAGVARVHGAPRKTAASAAAIVRAPARGSKHRQIAVGHRDSSPLADQRQHGLAAKAREAVGERRLVAKVGEDRRKRCARNVGGGKTSTSPGRARRRRDRRTRSGRGHAASGPRAAAARRAGGPGRRRTLGAVDLGPPSSRGGARRPRRPAGAGASATRPRRPEHRRDDLAVAGAAAQDAAERVLDLGLGRLGFVRGALGAAISMPGRADAALRGAVAQEGGLQRRERAVGRRGLRRSTTARPGAWRRRSGRRRPARRRAARCRRRNRRRRSRPWCR